MSTLPRLPGRTTPKRRWISATATLLSLILVLLTVLPMSEASAYVPERLVVTVYPDGGTGIDYTVSLDPVQTSAEISLFGQTYTNMIVINEADLPLDFSVIDGSVQIHTLGSLFAIIDYETPDLTSKEGRVWTAALEAPISFLLKLPENTTILGLSTVPESITTIDGRYLLTMPPGHQNVTYITGPVGTEEQATTLIEEAQQEVEDARSAGADVSEAESTLQEAEEALEEGRYGDAEMLARRAKGLAQEALTRSTQGISLPYPLDNPLVLLGLTSIVVVAILVYAWRRPRKEAQPPVDIEPILERHPDLRFDEREVIKLLGAAGGKVFEAEIRDRMGLAKSSTWRMMQRLEDEGIIEISKVRGQNLIQLREET